ncbi:MAG: hypothetical protein NC112_02495 [Oxalobacter formigenes]|nr:hypothetical protein [Oxalobacter formigenes]
MPTTKSSILARAAKEGWRYEEQYGIGGLRKVFEVPDRYLFSDRPDSGVVARQDVEEYLTAEEENRQDKPSAVPDESRLALAARIVEEWLDREKLVLNHERKGNLIAILYMLVSRYVSPKDLLRLMCAVAFIFKDLPMQRDEGQNPVSEAEEDG